MLTKKIAPQDIKPFMNTLLRSEVFDFFEVRGADITTFTHFSISGHMPAKKVPAQEDGVETLEKTKYCKWSQIRPYAYDIIKGGVKPAYIKLIFSLEPIAASALHENSAAMYLNIHFNGEEAVLTSATAQAKFSLDKSIDHVWEEYLHNFFAENQIKTQEVEIE